MTDSAIIIGFAGFWVIVLGGWIANVVKFAGALADPLTALELLRAVGIIAFPLGAILGFL